MPVSGRTAAGRDVQMRKLMAALAAAGACVWCVGASGTAVRASVSKGSLSGYRAAEHNPYGVNNQYGMVNFSIEHAGAEHFGTGTTVHQRVREVGAGWVRYWLSWEVVQPNNDPNPVNWNWAQADFDIDAAVAEGLNVYVTILGAPAWAHGGVPTYSWLQCYVRIGDLDAYDETRPGCGPAGAANAWAPFDPAGGNQSANWKHFVAEAVKRSSDRVKYWGFWNEPNERHFWPEQGVAPCYDRLGQLVDKVIKPGRDAALAVNPGIVVVGPDEYHPDAVEHFLKLEQTGHCGRGPYGRLFDVLAIHAYNIQADGGSLRAIFDKMAPYFRREVWITETNGGSGMANALLHFGRNGWISKVFPGDMRAPGPCRDIGLNLLDENKLPCPAYGLLQGHIAANPPAMHFAGTTGEAGHHDFVLLQNPHAYATRATVLYSNAAGSVIERPYDLPPTSRTTVHVPTQGHGGVEQGVSVLPASPSLPIWAEHADYWNSQEAGRNSQGTGERSDRWYFAEGVVGGTYLETRQHGVQPERAPHQGDLGVPQRQRIDRGRRTGDQPARPPPRPRQPAFPASKASIRRSSAPCGRAGTPRGNRRPSSPNAPSPGTTRSRATARAACPSPR